jgi:drug/metabolite transporter (DMT)-like permease
MTDQTPPPSPDWREQRREEHARRREERWGGNGAWVGGTVLIVLGVIFLANNLGFFLPHNWWAVFLLIPAAGSFGSAWSMYQRSGQQVTAGVRGATLGGVILVALAGAFFFDFDWGKYWPVILILLGIAALGGGAWRR